MKIDKFYQLGFRKTNITIHINEDNLLSYNTKTKDDGNLALSGIYVIAGKINKDEINVIYVGKSGKGINKRFREHEAGYLRAVKSMSSKNNIVKKNSLYDEIIKFKSKSVDVWFRPSDYVCTSSIYPMDGDHFRVSTYSLQEEALIVYLKQNGYSLINRSIPSYIINDSISENESPKSGGTEIIDDYSFNDIKNLIIKNTDDKFHKVFKEYLDQWSLETVENFCAVIERIKNSREYQKLDMKVVGAYTSGPFRHQHLLAFGDLAQTKFRKEAQILISLDGKYMALNPFNISRIVVIRIDDFLCGF